MHVLSWQMQQCGGSSIIIGQGHTTAMLHSYPPPPPLSFPTPGKAVPRHPLGDGHQVTVAPPPGGPHYHRTRTLWGTEIAAEDEITRHKKRWCAELVTVTNESKQCNNMKIICARSTGCQCNEIYSLTRWV